MFILYDLIFLIIASIYLPIYIFRRKFHKGFLQRLGFLPKGLVLGRPVWVHAVSVGEAMAVKGLIAELRKAYPSQKFVISTVTPTGNTIARTLASGGDFVTYLPFDFSFIIGRAINRINPSLFIIAETELWPNLISYLYKKSIPVVIVNGRLSDGSFRGYSSIKFFIKPVLRKVRLFCVQSERDKMRLIRLGAQAEKVKISGNMKFDKNDDTDSPAKLSDRGRDPASREREDYTDYRLKLGLGPNDKLFVAGSTHPGEEEAVLDVYKQLRINFPSLRLLIAPRHPQRCLDIAKIVSRLDYNGALVSKLPSDCPSCLANSVFILDTVGQLLGYYAAADIVFVGGSLIKKGGHNILEPALFAKPIIFGPHMFNFRDITSLFLGNNAAIMVGNTEELALKLSLLLNNPAQAVELGQRAKQLILQNQGATVKTVEYIKDLEKE